MRLLIATITYEGEAHARAPFLDALKAQGTHDLLIVDNSDNDAYLERLRLAVRDFGARARVEHVVASGRFGKILTSRQRVRQRFLEGKYTHLLMVDSDVIIPNDAVTLFGKRTLATGIYLNTFNIAGKPSIRPCLFIDIDGRARHASVAEVLSQEELPIGAAGLGCTFVAREVLEAVAFRTNAHGTGEDIMFYRDAYAAGFPAVAVTSIKCAHLHFPLGDPRNHPFDFVRYRLEGGR